MKHTYSGTDLRGHGRIPAESPLPQEPQHAPADRAAAPRGGLVLGIAVLVVVLAGLAALGLWAWNGRTPAEPAPEGRNFVPAGPAAGASLEGYLNPGPLRIRQLFEYVKNSEHVQGNSQYRESLDRVAFVYEDGNDEVNARAAAMEKGGDGKAFEQEIRCCAGAVRFARLVSLGLAAELAGRDGAVQALLGAMEPWQFGTLPPGDAEAAAELAGLEEVFADPAVLTKAESIASGMLLAVLAHECGHQALGHVFGPAANPEISRNQEREADAFASSVISSSGFGEYMFDGMLFWHYALVARDGGGDGTGTHPLAKERLENLVLQNPSKAAAWGIEPGTRARVL